MRRRGRILLLVLRRLRFVIVQMLAAAAASFFLIRLIPGDPARVLAGVAASPETIQAIREHLGLDKALPLQFGIYLQNAFQGDLGDSLSTGQSVFKDLYTRAPATLELTTLALIVSFAIGLPLGLALARRKRGLLRSGVFGYSMLSGAIPDFWLALILIYAFATKLGIAPAPVGRLGFNSAPPHLTGFYVIDSIAAGQWHLLGLALSHLALPVFTLVLVYSGLIVKVAGVAAAQADRSGFMDLFESAGVGRRLARRRATRLALPPVFTITGILYGYLLGGTVLVEQIFSWGGLGQYLVQAIKGADYAAVQGFVLLAVTFNVVVYLLVDVLLYALDPRLGRRQ